MFCKQPGSYTWLKKHRRKRSSKLANEDLNHGVHVLLYNVGGSVGVVFFKYFACISRAHPIAST